MRPRATDRSPVPSSQVLVGCSGALDQGGVPQPALVAPDLWGAR